MTTKFRAILCDMDGTFVNTEDISHKGYHLACSKFGKEFTEILHRQIMGTKSDYWSQYIVDQLSLPISPENFKLLCAELEHDLIESDIRLVDGFKLLMESVRQSGSKFVLVTSSKQASVERNLRLLEIDDPFDSWVTAEVVKKGKPDPEPFLLGAQKAGVEPKHCLAIEDSSMGVQSASSAGACVLAVPGRYSRGADFSSADEVFDNLNDCVHKVRDLLGL